MRSPLIFAVILCLAACAPSRTVAPPPSVPSAAGVTPEMAAPPAAPRPPRALVGVRLLKHEGVGDLDWAVSLPANCEDCEVVLNEHTSTENELEFYFHLWAPRSLGGVEGLEVSTAPGSVRRVLVGKSDRPFEETGGVIRFDAPIHAREDRVAELHYWIDRPGLHIRVEVPDRRRRYGLYADGPWPEVELAAALNLQFAAREAVQRLGLDRRMVEEGLGDIVLMGFDINYPTLGPKIGHRDHPPHWHMHVHWSGEIRNRLHDHQYIDAGGLLTHNIVSGGDRHPTEPAGRFERGERHLTRTPAGEDLFAHTLTAAGGLLLEAGDGVCEFTPEGPGFHTGARLSCNDARPDDVVRAAIDPLAGVLEIDLAGAPLERHRFDPDTALAIAP